LNRDVQWLSVSNCTNHLYILPNGYTITNLGLHEDRNGYTLLAGHEVSNHAAITGKKEFVLNDVEVWQLKKVE